MLTRRKLIMGAVATALVGLGATPALARDERLLVDILYGVSDALVRDYIRDRYEDGRWDGHYWYYGGHRYTPHEYGRYWAEEYHRQPPKKPKKRKKPHPHPRDWDDDDDDDDDRRRPRLHLTGDDGSRGARSWRTGPSGDFKKAATPTRSALPFSWPPVKRELRYGVRRARACGSRT